MFRALLVVMVCVGAGRASADPLGRLELGARFGAQWTSLYRGDSEPEEWGPLVDVNVGWKLAPWFSLGLYGSYASFRDTERDPFDYATTYARSFRILEVGPRASFHYQGVIGGFDLARHSTTITDRESGRSGTSSGTVVGIHLGYTFPRIDRLGGIAFQVLVMATRGSTDAADDALRTRRIAVGFEL